MREGGYDRMVPTAEASDQWGGLIEQTMEGTILAKGEEVGSYYVGANIPGRPHKSMFYFGGIPNYFRLCQEVVDNDFEGIKFSTTPSVGSANAQAQMA
jgi:cyclohexanone monooxygenase